MPTKLSSISGQLTLSTPDLCNDNEQVSYQREFYFAEMKLLRFLQ